MASWRRHVFVHAAPLAAIVRRRLSNGVRSAVTAATTTTTTTTANNNNNNNNNNPTAVHPRVTIGIESSCDDSAVAAVRSDGSILFNLVSSQWDLHAKWGGVVPRLAARAHDNNLPLLLAEAARRLQGEGITADQVAVTTGPGLAPCLRVGVDHARKFADELGLPLVPVHHLEAHLLSPRINGGGGKGANGISVSFPYLAVLASGGHCMIALVEGVGSYKILGSSLDDSMGEAFDKVARELGCVADGGRHPGAMLEQLAGQGDAERVELRLPMEKHADSCAFSFSGLKSQVVRVVERHDHIPRGQSMLQVDPSSAANIAAAFQYTAIKHLVTSSRRALAWLTVRSDAFPTLANAPTMMTRARLRKWAKEARRRPDGFATLQSPLTCLVACGGVAANRAVRAALEALATEVALPLVVPPAELCTDNGAMVAWAAMERQRFGLPVAGQGLEIHPRLPLSSSLSS